MKFNIKDYYHPDISDFKEGLVYLYNGEQAYNNGTWEEYTYSIKDSEGIYNQDLGQILIDVEEYPGNFLVKKLDKKDFYELGFTYNESTRSWNIGTKLTIYKTIEEFYYLVNNSTVIKLKNRLDLELFPIVENLQETIVVQYGKGYKYIIND